MNIVNVRGRGGRGRRVIQRKKPKYQTQSAHSQRENTRLHRQRRKKRGRQYTKDHEVAHLEATPRTQCTLDRAKNTVDLLSAITPQSGQILMGVLRTLLSNTLTIGVPSGEEIIIPPASYGLVVDEEILLFHSELPCSCSERRLFGPPATRESPELGALGS